MVPAARRLSTSHWRNLRADCDVSDAIREPWRPGAPARTSPEPPASGAARAFDPSSKSPAVRPSAPPTACLTVRSPPWAGCPGFSGPSGRPAEVSVMPAADRGPVDAGSSDLWLGAAPRIRFGSRSLEVHRALSMVGSAERRFGHRGNRCGCLDTRAGTDVGSNHRTRARRRDRRPRRIGLRDRIPFRRTGLDRHHGGAAEVRACRSCPVDPNLGSPGRLGARYRCGCTSRRLRRTRRCDGAGGVRGRGVVPPAVLRPRHSVVAANDAPMARRNSGGDLRHRCRRRTDRRGGIELRVLR